MKRNKTLGTALACLMGCAATAAAQLSQAGYFMKYSPQQHQYNPAFRPIGKFYFALPAHNFSLDGGNNSLTFDDVIKNVMVDGQSTSLFFLDRRVEGGTADFLDALYSTETVFADYRLNIASFGFRTKHKGYVTFDINNRMEVRARIPKALPEFLLLGMKEGKEFDFQIDDLATSATLWSEAALGYSHEVNNRFTVGGKLKYLYGHANADTKFSDLKVTGSENKWNIKGDASVHASIPGLVITTNEDGQIDDVDFDEGSIEDENEDIDIKKIAKQRGAGLAVDLGATYNLLPNLQFSASVLDLGFLRWRKDLNELRKTNDFTFDGVHYDINKDEDSLMSDYEDMLKEMYIVDENPGKYTSWLSIKVMLGAEYSVWKDRLSVGVLSKTTIYKRRLYEDLRTALNFRPWKQLSLSGSIGLFDRQWTNIGAAMNLNMGPINFFTSVDNIPLKWGKTEDDIMFPTHTRYVRANLGINWMFGYSTRKKKKQPAVRMDRLELVSQTQMEEPAVKDTTPTANADTLHTAGTVTTDSVRTDTIAMEPQKAEYVPADMSEVAPEAREVAENALNGIRFRTDGIMDLDTRCYPILDRLASVLGKYDYHVNIMSYNWSENNPDFNYFQSREHARLIMDYLISKGVDEERLSCEGMGQNGIKNRKVTPKHKTVLEYSKRKQ